MGKLGKRIGEKVLACACAAAITVTLIPMTGALAASVTAQTTDYINLRAGAGTDKKILLTLSKGATVTILDNSNAQWAKVQTPNGTQGYLSKQYLKTQGTPTPSSPAVPSGSTSAETTDYVNLRAGAGTDKKVILTLSKGVAVKILDNLNSVWAKVQTPNGTQGYISKEYLKASGTSSTPPTSSNTPSSSAPTTPAATVTAVTTEYMNLREGAGTNFKVTGTLNKGISLKVLDNSNAQWAKVQTANGVSGYCAKQYLKITVSTGTTTPSSVPPASSTPSTPSIPSTPTTPIPVPATATTTSALNVRSGMGTNYNILVTLGKGASVTVIDSSNSAWVKIRTGSGLEGYCSKEFLSISNAQTPNTGGTGTTPGTGTNTEPGTTPGTGTHTIVGASVNADLLRLRAAPDANGAVLTNLPKGTSLKVLDTSNSVWTKVQTPGNQTGYVSTEFIQFRYSDDPINTGGGLSLSTTAQSVPTGKTLYIKATVSQSSAAVNWTSSNTGVATVSNGYVYAVANGTAVITASAGSSKATCTVTVTDAEPVKTAYASPNIASPGTTVTLTAVTDTSRDSVQFAVQMPDGSTRTLSADGCTQENVLNTNTKKWTATTSFNTPGTYSFTAFSWRGGVRSTVGCTSSAYVSTQQDFSVTTNEARRISDRMIALISKWEGYRPTVYADMLTANQVPTIGYGCTFGPNAIFYNDMTETEAWSMLVNKINTSTYTSELNKMIQNNRFLMNQNQADCLISFAYNVGAGYFNGSTEMDFRRIMKNAVVPPTIYGSLAATVTKDTVVRSDASISAGQVCSISSGTAISVTDSNFTNPKDGWYKVSLSNATVGWINSGYVNLSGSDSLVHDLNYTNAYAIGTDLLRWSTASGKFYAGLFYRRMGEVNAFNYGDYDAVRFNKYNYGYPSGAAGLN